MGIDITEVKFRRANSPKYPDLYAIASITLNNEIAINDIRVYKRKNGSFKIKLPNHPFSTMHNTKNIEALTQDSWKKIRSAIIEKIKQ